MPVCWLQAGLQSADSWRVASHEAAPASMAPLIDLPMLSQAATGVPSMALLGVGYGQQANRARLPQRIAMLSVLAALLMMCHAAGAAQGSQAGVARGPKIFIVEPTEGALARHQQVSHEIQSPSCVRATVAVVAAAAAVIVVDVVFVFVAVDVVDVPFVVFVVMVVVVAALTVVVIAAVVVARLSCKPSRTRRGVEGLPQLKHLTQQ
eukprot:351542-Chlamydomonas_euryale.AAC.5